MRAGVGLIILALLACALLAANQHKPFEIQIDAQSPGAWPKYAAAPTTVPASPDLVCMYAFIPGSMRGGENPITET